MKLNNTLNNLKQIGKKGVAFIKAISLDTITSLKDDICQHREKRKAQEEWWNSTHPSNNPSSND